MATTTTSQPLAPAFFAAQHKACLHLLNSYNRKRSAEDLHRLRVAIKKIKAVINLAAKADKKFNPHTAFTVYREIFKISGKIRHLHLQQDILKKHDVEPDAEHYDNAMAKLNNQFKSVASVFTKASAAGTRSINKALKKLGAPIVLKLCIKMFKKLKRKAADMGKSKDPHKYRKRSKQLIYCAMLLPDDVRKTVISSRKLKYLDSLQHHLGLWHDNIVFIEQIKEEKIKGGHKCRSKVKKEARARFKKAEKYAGKL